MSPSPHSIEPAARRPAEPPGGLGHLGAATSDSARLFAAGLPFSAVLGFVAGLAVFATSQTPLRDIDVFWHVLAGQQLLAGVAPTDVGSNWSFAPQPLPWTSTQWLSEIAFAGLHQAFGWAGPAAFRVTTAAAAIGVLALTTLRGRARAIAGFPFLLATAMLAFVSQDRPAQFTLIGAAALGGVLVTGLTAHRLPRWYFLLPVTTLWANLHGGWVLVPAVLFLIGIGVALDSGTRVPVVRNALLLGLAATAAGCLTPSGLGGLTAPLRFSKAAVLIKEWAAVEPTSTLGWMTLAMLALFLVGWSAGRVLPRSEAFVVLALLCFTWLANRNLALGMALMAPLAAHVLCRAFPGVGRPEPRWSATLGITVALLFTAAGVVSVATTSNLPSNSQPLALAKLIATLPPGQRVLNDYNTSGVVLFLGGPATKVAIDGRTDRYGADYIKHYVELSSLRGDWESLLAQLRPTAALLDVDAPLSHLLVNERGWRQVGPVEARHVLLLPPSQGAPGKEPAQPTAGPVRGGASGRTSGSTTANRESTSAQGKRNTKDPTVSPKPAVNANPAPTARPAEPTAEAEPATEPTGELEPTRPPVTASTTVPPTAGSAPGPRRPLTSRPPATGLHPSTSRTGPPSVSSRAAAGTATICPKAPTGCRKHASPASTATPSPTATAAADAKRAAASR